MTIDIKTIYRVEHNVTGDGPFTHYWEKENSELFMLATQTIDNHPTLSEDVFVRGNKKLLDYLGNCLFGCINKESLLSWFGLFLNVLKKEDFLLVEYTTPIYNLLEFEKQVVIVNKDLATFVSAKSLDFLKN